MEKWSAHARPVLAGLIGAAANVGFLSVSVLSLALHPDDYWRVFLMVCSFPALLTFLIRTFVLESEKWEEAAAKAPSPGLGAIFRPALRSRSLLGAGLGACADASRQLRGHRRLHGGFVNVAPAQGPGAVHK